MNVLFARARARGSQLGLATSMESEKLGRTTRGKGRRCATKFRRILSCAGRGTGLDRREGEFSPIGARECGAGGVTLSSLALSSSVRFQGVPNSHLEGVKTASEMGLFWGKSSHLVPFSPTHFYLFETCEAWPGCRVTERGRRTTNLPNLTNQGTRKGAISQTGADGYQHDGPVPRNTSQSRAVHGETAVSAAGGRTIGGPPLPAAAARGAPLALQGTIAELHETAGRAPWDCSSTSRRSSSSMECRVSFSPAQASVQHREEKVARTKR